MSTEQLSIKAPAKLNLRLKVVGRREDGYHLLSMLNATIGLFDEISIKRNDNGVELKAEENDFTEHLGSPKDNLIVKAANLFFENFGLSNHGISISLKKFIPIGAGLGGGSSDAAATLVAMSQLFNGEIQGRVTKTELIKLGAKLGSDVPYFIEGGLCIVSGVGEKVFKITDNPLRAKPFLLICPNEHSSTLAVYKDFTASLPTEDLLPDPDLQNLKPSYESILKLIANDLSISVFKRAEICKELVKIMSSFGDVVCGLTGSGSALFCIPKQEFDVLALNKVKSALPKSVASQILDFY